MNTYSLNFKPLQRMMLLILLSTLCCSTAWGDQLTVCDGTQPNNFLPVIGTYLDTEDTRTQFVMPKDLLKDMKDKEITSMTFYSTSESVVWEGAVVRIRLKEVTVIRLDGFEGTGDAKTLYQGELSVSNNLMTINFDTPYLYQGGNLLFESYVIRGGNFSSCSFYGTVTNGPQGCVKYSEEPESVDFLPKTTFTYYAPAPYPMPANIRVENITTTGATVKWDAVTDATSYDVVIKQGETTLYSGNQTANSYALTKLQAATIYNISVQVTAKGEQGESRTATKSIKFGTNIASLPWSEDFENLAINEAPAGWTLLERCNTDKQPTEIYVKADKDYVHGGSKSLFFYAREGQKAIAIMPAFSADLSKAEITFWYNFGFEGYDKLSVGYITDVTDGSTFVALQELDKPSGFTEVFQSLATVPSGARLAFCYLSAEGYDGVSLGIDDITVQQAPPYATPANIRVEDITGTSATVKWDAVTDATSYDVVIKQGETTLYSGNQTANSYALTTLQEATVYNISIEVTAKGENGKSRTATKSINFSTNIATLPWSEGFENFAINEAPAGWTLLKRCNTDKQPTEICVKADEYYVHGGSKSLFFNARKGQKAIAIMPGVSADLSKAEITFWYNSGYDGYGKLSVGYITDVTDGSTFVALQELDKPSGFTEVFQPLATVPSGSRLAFCYLSAEYDDGVYLGIDDVVVQQAPPYATPANISVEDITGTSAMVKWDAVTDATSYDVVIKQGETTLNSGNSETNSYALTNLQAATVYNISIEVTAKGEKGESRAAMKSIKFSTTVEAIATLPWSNNFDHITEIEEALLGWNLLNLNNEGSFYPRLSITTDESSAYSGTTLFFQAENGQNSIAVLPAFSADLTNAKISFVYSTRYSDSPISIGYITDITDIETYVPLQQLPLTYPYIEVNQMLGSVPEGARLAICHHGHKSSDQACIDNISVTKAGEGIDPTKWNTALSEKSVVNLTFAYEAPSGATPEAYLNGGETIGLYNTGTEDYCVAPTVAGTTVFAPANCDGLFPSTLKTLTIYNFDMSPVSKAQDMFGGVETVTFKMIPFVPACVSLDGSTVNIEFDDNTQPYLGTNNLPSAYSTTYTRSIAEGSDWGTVVLPFKVDINNSDVSLYSISDLNYEDDDYSLNVKKVSSSDAVQPNTPYLFKKKTPNATSVTFKAEGQLDLSQTITSVRCEKGYYSVEMIGTYHQIAINGYYEYYMAQNSLWYAEEEATINPFRAWFSFDYDDDEGEEEPEFEEPSEAPARFTIVEDETDAITAVSSEEVGVSRSFDLMGRHISEDRKGLQVRDGRVVWVK